MVNPNNVTIEVYLRKFKLESTNMNRQTKNRNFKLFSTILIFFFIRKFVLYMLDNHSGHCSLLFIICKMYNTFVDMGKFTFCFHSFKLFCIKQKITLNNTISIFQSQSLTDHACNPHQQARDTCLMRVTTTDRIKSADISLQVISLSSCLYISNVRRSSIALGKNVDSRGCNNSVARPTVTKTETPFSKSNHKNSANAAKTKSDCNGTLPSEEGNHTS